MAGLSRITHLRRIDLLRMNDWVLGSAAALLPTEFRPLAAIHLTGALQLGNHFGSLVSYGQRIRTAARHLGISTASPK